MCILLTLLLHIIQLTGNSRIMRPNTPHTVFTPEPTVVRGGHFYATSTLTDTLIGWIHAFMANGLVTNTEHHSARLHLGKMVGFFYTQLIEKGKEMEEDGRSRTCMIIRH